MAESIPNLWRDNPNPTHLYQLYIARLMLNRRRERIVRVCRQIRRYAKVCGRVEDALFTYSLEIDSLCDLHNYKAAWRQLRRWEVMIFGNRFDLEHHQWSIEEASVLESWHAPILYFLGRYPLGCQLLETTLDFAFQPKSVQSYDLMFHIYNDDEEPSNRCRVTLSHFYNRLGKDLKSWRHWDAFVRGFHSQLLRVAEIRREELAADSRLLAPFFNRLMDLRNERITSGVGGTQSDLVDSAAKVKKRQDDTKRELEAFEERTKRSRERTNQRLLDLFPELQNLPR